MSSPIVRGQHASHFTSNPSHAKRDIAAEAFHRAVDDLEKELKASEETTKWANSHADAEAILEAVQEAKQKYHDESKSHSGTRAWLEKFSGRVMYYTKVFDALAQHHPEYVALAWGSVKFVLMGIINRATLVEKLAQAFVAIGDVLPRANLGAELYQTGYMKDALSRLYAYIILFLRLCVRWYNKSSIGRFVSAITSPFELDYQELIDQIKVSSAAVEHLANAGARVEIRDIRTIQDLHQAQMMDLYGKLLDRQVKFEDSIMQLIQVTTSTKTITERIGENVSDIGRTVYRLEFHTLVDFLAPSTLPGVALSTIKSFSRRDPTISLSSREDLKIKRILNKWASVDRSSLLVVRMGLRAQAQARVLAANVIQGLDSSSQCILWNLSLSRSPEGDNTLGSVFKALIHQILQISADLFAQFAEELNLIKIRSAHTDSEWADLICLLLSKVPRVFVILETGGLHKAYRNDPDWVDRLLRLLQRVIEQTATAGNQLKILLMVYGKASAVSTESSSAYDMNATSLSPPAPVPARLRHVARRSGMNMRSWKLQVPKT